MYFQNSMHHQKLNIRHFLKSRLLLFSVGLLCACAVGAQAVTPEQLNRSALFEALANARSEATAREVEDKIWRFWLAQSPTPEVRSLMDKGMERREAYDYEAAEAHFDQAVALAPEYAEALNQRAFIRFLRENYAGSLSDLEKTVELEPQHFGALAGMYLVLLRQDRREVALRQLQTAVALHPWLSERHGLPEAMWPDNYRLIHSKGQDI